MKLPRRSTTVGILLFLASVGFSLVYIFYMWLVFSKASPPSMLTFLDSWDSRNVILVDIVVFGISLIILFNSRKKNPSHQLVDVSKMQYEVENNPQFDNEMDPNPEPQTPKIVGEVTLAKLLGAAMNQGLISTDLNFTLKLPADTKLNILGQEWEVQNGSITISKAKTEEKKTLAPSQAKPEDMMTKEEKDYYLKAT